MSSPHWGMAFQIQVSGKWILTGEHSVLRGKSAIAMPHWDVELNLSFKPDLGDFEVHPSSAQELLQELILSAEVFLNRSLGRPTGKLLLESQIPIGAGFGSSAALCVALMRWITQGMVFSKRDEMEFARHLEHRFHGHSSGMDVAAICLGEPIVFYSEGMQVTPVGVKSLPRFTFHDTGMRARTSDCILQVERLKTSDPQQALKLDLMMEEASQMALRGLVDFDTGQQARGLELLQQAMQKARSCFYGWDLVPEPARQLESELLQQGALAVKLTGAGGGGMIVALWEK